MLAINTKSFSTVNPFVRQSLTRCLSRPSLSSAPARSLINTSSCSYSVFSIFSRKQKQQNTPSDSGSSSNHSNNNNPHSHSSNKSIRRFSISRNSPSSSSLLSRIAPSSNTIRSSYSHVTTGPAAPSPIAASSQQTLSSNSSVVGSSTSNNISSVSPAQTFSSSPINSSRDSFLRDQELHKLHTSTLLPPSIPLDPNARQPITDPLNSRSLFDADNNTKLLDDSYNYDAMPFEELLESFEEEPFLETHSSSSLGHTIVVYKTPRHHTAQDDINPLSPSFDLNELNDRLASRGKIFDDSPFSQPLADSPFPASNSTSDTEAAAAASSPSSSAAVRPVFTHGCGLKFQYAVSGYAYHNSKDSPRRPIIESLPHCLIDPDTHTYELRQNAAAAQTKISIRRGEHALGDNTNDGYADGEYPLTDTTPPELVSSPLEAKKNSIYDIPVGAYDKIEMREVTSLGCGEDSVVGSPQMLVLADGVSGWNSRANGHSALWSRLLVNRTLSNFVDLFNTTSPEKLKEQGIERDLTIEDGLHVSDLHISKSVDKSFGETVEILSEMNEVGSSTLVATALDTVNKSLHFISIGDSCIWVFREREVLFTIDHGVKTGCPKQIGTNTKSTPTEIDTPATLDVLPGDVVLMCSDGLADNLFISEITEKLFEAYDQGGVQKAADELVALAVDRSFDTFAVCPYQLNAAPFSTGGGKSDDISVVVAEIVADN